MCVLVLFGVFFVCFLNVCACVFVLVFCVGVFVCVCVVCCVLPMQLRGREVSYDPNSAIKKPKEGASPPAPLKRRRRAAAPQPCLVEPRHTWAA